MRYAQPLRLHQIDKGCKCVVIPFPDNATQSEETIVDLAYVLPLHYDFVIDVTERTENQTEGNDKRHAMGAKGPWRRRMRIKVSATQETVKRQALKIQELEDRLNEQQIKMTEIDGIVKLQAQHIQALEARGGNPKQERHALQRRAPPQNKGLLQLEDQKPQHPLKGRPANAYSFFQSKYRAEHAAEIQGFSSNSISTTIAKVWKSMDSQEKQPFEDQFQEALRTWEATRASRNHG